MGKPDEGERYVDDLGTLVIRRPAEGVLLFVETGYLVGTRAPLIQKALDDELRAHQELIIFVDGEQLRGYDPPIRTVPSDWLKKHAAQVVCQHMLVRSQVAKMGLSVARLVLGALVEGHTERSTFERALEDAVRGRVAGPRVSWAPLSR